MKVIDQRRLPHERVDPGAHARVDDVIHAIQAADGARGPAHRCHGGLRHGAWPRAAAADGSGLGATI
ncbi:MAG: hypothetical protein MZV70_18720 [Desulfobacterales bacterium]|nr:hypothetical protein [Desulfobacterales bacterium]